MIKDPESSGKWKTLIEDLVHLQGDCCTAQALDSISALDHDHHHHEPVPDPTTSTMFTFLD